MFGIFVFAGLVAVPLIWGQFTNLPYDRLVAGSLVGCAVFAYAHTRDGKFSVSRFIVGFGFVFLMSLRITARSGGLGGFIPGGFLGFLVMSGCGWLGIWIARALGFSGEWKALDPVVLPTAEEPAHPEPDGLPGALVTDAAQAASGTDTPVSGGDEEKIAGTDTELQNSKRLHEAGN
jgi:hypothetical protein